MMQLIDLRGSALSASELRNILPRAELDVGRALGTAAELISAVRDEGSSALREQAARLDGVEPPHLRVPQEEIDEATAGLELQVRAALEAMIRQVENPDERAVLRLRYFDRADWDGICAVLFSDRQDYLERIDSYQNRTYKAHGRALLRMAEILKETEAPAVKGSKRQ